MAESGVGLFDNLRKLINVVDELRDVGLQQYINLPRIAVLGTQSSGKSSLLESIVGIDFLPRGEGVVTRRPLELRLVHDLGADEPWGVFEVEKGKKYTNFEQVTNKINELTDQVAGKNKGIIDDPIVLTVHSKSCPDLTVVDLPGITRIPLANSDQPKDIERITREMAGRYCRDPRTIILCVIPANADLSTSDALQMARELDPEGTRTIGVFTKIDIMDKGTNARRMILGQDIPMRLGYVGVKGRSQQDIFDKVAVKKALDTEKNFFATHPAYANFPPGHLGTEVLIQKLTKILYEHIRNYLPEIVKEINNKIKDTEEKLRDLGPPLPRSQSEKMQLLWNMITDFTENFKNSIRGKYDSKRSQRVNKDMSGGAMIKLMFNDLYEDYSKGDFRATNDYSDKDIEKAIIMHQGDSIPGFPSIDSFLYLIQPQLEKLKEPAIELLNSVYGYLENLATKIINKLFVRFPQIIDEITDIVCKVLQEQREKTRQNVEDLITAEESYLFTNDFDYLMSRSNLIPKVDGPGGQGKAMDPNKVFITEMRSRIDSYFALVVKNLRDSIPKLIGTFLVRSAEEKMQYALYNEVNRSQEIMTLLGEPSHVTAERDTLTKILNILKKAQKVLKKDPDLAPGLRVDDEEEERPASKTTASGATSTRAAAHTMAPKPSGANSLFGKQWDSVRIFVQLSFDVYFSLSLLVSLCNLEIAAQSLHFYTFFSSWRSISLNLRAQ
eukprot:TRINITY_DN4881_c0_g2_i13.p1 TRINITY_DN4881_c0_g2~~TRINITY_DN4881_c0_g2_i13.p1  ORF type:complete len:725 (+),score=184.79 TRINITY_DN4881_c0_g2_i13:160-2334(+)